MKLKNVLSFVKCCLPCALLLLIAGSVSATAQETLRLQKASTEYDVVVSVKGCGGAEQDNVEDFCSGPGSVSLYRKGSKSAFQVLRLPEIWLDKKTVAHNPKINEEPRQLYAEEYAIVFDDFNFDGRDDLAVCNGRNSGYGGPSYTVYLFDRRSKKFFENKRLSALADAPYLGFFFIDQKKKELVAYSKSGCCYHETEKYRMVNNRPVLVEKIIEDATHGNGAGEGFVLVTTRKKVGGRWVVRRRREKLEEENE